MQHSILPQPSRIHRNLLLIAVRDIAEAGKGVAWVARLAGVNREPLPNVFTKRQSALEHLDSCFECSWFTDGCGSL